MTVVDGSPVPPRRRWHPATATTGRGLQMLRELADDWGWDPVGDGKAVWFLLRGAADAPAGGHAGTGRDRTGPPAASPSPLGRYGPAPETAGLSDADEFGRSAQLITLARTPAMVRFGQWYVGQFVDRIAGRRPTRWTGPLDPGGPGPATRPPAASRELGVPGSRRALSPGRRAIMPRG